MSKSLIRPARGRGRVIAGVCAAIANRFSMSATVVRIIFVASMLLPGPQILIYLALWIFLPGEKRRTRR
jgi:phage shock protein PspC (stress-responsive transcriptional regulator)